MKEELIKEIENDFKLALIEFKKKDLSYFDIEDSERAKVFRVGYYLQKIMEQKDIYNQENLVVDCEYNRMVNDNTRFSKSLKPNERNREDNIMPDLIVHQRNTNKNLLVCEFKNKRKEDSDDEKLKEFKNNTFFNYRLVYFVSFQNLFNNIKIEEVIEEYK